MHASGLVSAEGHTTLSMTYDSLLRLPAPRSWQCFRGWGPYVSLALPTVGACCLEWWLYEGLILIAGCFPSADAAVAAMGVGARCSLGKATWAATATCQRFCQTFVCLTKCSCTRAHNQTAIQTVLQVSNIVESSQTFWGMNDECIMCRVQHHRPRVHHLQWHRW